MEYVYAALLLHELGKKINEDNITKVIKATGEEPDEARAKALVASLEEVDIEEAISKPAVAAPAQAAAPESAEGKEESKEEGEGEEEEGESEEEKEEEAAEGLGTLFGE